MKIVIKWEELTMVGNKNLVGESLLRRRIAIFPGGENEKIFGRGGTPPYLPSRENPAVYLEERDVLDLLVRYFFH